MTVQKNRIHDVIKKPRSLLAKVSYRTYMTNKKEPAETISEMHPPSMDLQAKDMLKSARQRRGIRKLATNLRLRNRA